MLKWIAACLIATGLVLPLSSCHTYRGPEQEEVLYVDGKGVPTTPASDGSRPDVVPIEVYAKAHALPAGLHVQKHYKFFFTQASLMDGFLWLGVLALLWPLGWVVVTRWNGSQGFRVWVDPGSPLLLVGTGYVLMMRTAQGDHFEIGFWTTALGIWLWAALSASRWGEHLGRWFPDISSWLKGAVMLLLFALGSAIPCLMLKG